MSGAQRWGLRIVVAGVVLVALIWLLAGPLRSRVRPPGESARNREAPRATAETSTIALTSEQRQALGIKTDPVQPRSPEVPLSVTGRIMAKPERTVAVSPRTPGRVIKVQVQLGDTVEEGSTLALVDSVEAADALADLAQSESALALAQAEADRERELVERKIGARKDLLRAEAALEQARVQRDKVRDKLRLFGFSDARLAEARRRPPDQRALVPLTAPFRATVIERQVTEGQMLDAAAVPFRLADLGTVWAILDVPESEIAPVRIGQRATIEVGGDRGERHTGHVVYVSDVVEEQTRTVKVRVEIPNRERHFKPGMFVTGRIITQPTGPAALMVPNTAVVLMDQGSVVFVDHGATIEPRVVEVGREVSGWTPITKGLTAGEPVVTEGAFALKAQLVKAKLGEE